MEDANAPASKADLAEAAHQLRSEMKEQGEQLRSELRHGFDDLKKRLRDVQTELLKAFYAFAETSQSRHAQAEMNIQAVMARLVSVESRLLEVEKRLHLPPAA